MIAITEVTRGVHKTRRSTQQTLIWGEIGVQWPGVDSDGGSLLVFGDIDLFTTNPRVDDLGVASMVVESSHTDDSKEKSVQLHGITATVSSRLVAHFGTVETEIQGNNKHHEKAKAAHVIERRKHATDVDAQRSAPLNVIIIPTLSIPH
jgi:hypothetical protein